jgi:hypothetical protein
MITAETENGLRAALTRAADDIIVPEPARRRLLSRDYHPRMVNRRLTAGVAATVAAAAAAITVPLAAAGGSPSVAAGPVMRLAPYTFQLPTGYKLTAATSASCHAFAIVAFPGRLHAKDVRNPSSETAMKAAASASGGCIVAVLAPTYAPTAAMPDPEAPGPPVRPVQVGRYHGVITRTSFLVTTTDKKGIEHGFTPGWHSITELFVRLPAAGGKMRDLVVGASRLSESALIRIAANGLSS